MCGFAGAARALMKFVDVSVALVSLRLPGCRDAAMTDVLSTVHWHGVPKIHDCSSSRLSDISIIEVSVHNVDGLFNKSLPNSLDQLSCMCKVVVLMF